MLSHAAYKVNNHIMCKWGSPVVTATRLGTVLPTEQWLQYRLSLEPVEPPLFCAAGDLRLQLLFLTTQDNVVSMLRKHGTAPKTLADFN
jgi:hypothetical protein